VKSFTKGLEFFRIIADLAEAEGIMISISFFSSLFPMYSCYRKHGKRLNAGHHPDLHLVGWNNVTIEIWTHSAGMIYELLFIQIVCFRQS
jgi:4a-hydroxytetrahydrobiopterin dehydratase